MRALLCGYYGFGNGGDEALLISLLQQLPKHVEPIVLSQNPAYTSATYQVSACARMNTLHILEEAKQTQAFLFGGGSLLQDATSWRNPIYYAGLMGWAQRRGWKTVAWAQGIGPLNRAWSRWLTQQCLSGCSAVSVRDPRSAEWLDERGIPCLLAPDPVWALESEVLPSWEQVTPGGIAVVLRTHPQLTPPRIAILTQALIRLQEVTHAPVFLVPFHLSLDPDQPGDDERLARLIQQSLPEVSQVIRLADPRYLKGIFRYVRFTITMRYHGLVMAAAEGSRCFGLSYDPKVRILLEQLGMPGWDLEEMPTDPALMVEAWQACYELGSALTPEQRATWKAKALSHREVLDQVLRQD